MSFPNPNLINNPLTKSLYDSDDNHFANPGSEIWADEFGDPWVDEFGEPWTTT